MSRVLVLGAVLSFIAPGAAMATTHAVAVHPRSERPAIQLDCAATPSKCGYPDATNTGVPKSVKLKTVPADVKEGKGWHFDRRGWVVVDGKGAVLSGLRIPWSVNVTASDVTIKDDMIVHPDKEFEQGKFDKVGIALRHTSNVTIEDSLISGLDPQDHRLLAGIKDVFGDSTGLKIIRDNFVNCSTAVQLESGLINDDYIHDTGFRTGDHVNGVTSNGGKQGLLTISHDTIFTDREQTDAVGLFQDFGFQASRVITGNLLAGGGYVIYGGRKEGGAATKDIVITNNRFSRVYFPNGGKEGPVAYFDKGGSGNAWSGNFWDDTGKATPAP